MAAVVTSKRALGAGHEPEGAARRVEHGGRHVLQHAAPGSDADVGRVEVDPLDHREARAEIAREDGSAMASVQDEPGHGIDDERPRQDARGPEEIRHAGLPVRGGAFVRAKVRERGHGKTRSDVVR